MRGPLVARQTRPMVTLREADFDHNPSDPGLTTRGNPAMILQARGEVASCCYGATARVAWHARCLVQNNALNHGTIRPVTIAGNFGNDSNGVGWRVSALVCDGHVPQMRRCRPAAYPRPITTNGYNADRVADLRRRFDDVMAAS